MKTIHLFANWKMYLDYDESNILANAFALEFKKRPAGIEMAVFPSALSLYPVAQVLNDIGVGVGGQNAYWVDKGGYTGEISLQMFKNSGCTHQLIGHSERRHVFNETNHDVRQKVEAALAVGLKPVVCVGETREERQANRADEVVEIQLRAVFDNLSAGKGKEIFVAYEPVWAIGTGEACDADEAERMHGKIQEIAAALLPGASVKILYGGSVRADNVNQYLSKKHTDGVLIGNASAKLESFKEIYEQVLSIIQS